MLHSLRNRCAGGILRKLSTVAQPHPNTLTGKETGERVADALAYPDYFNVKDMFTIAQLFEARVHYGHKVSSLNDAMTPFVYGQRAGHIIFNLNITAFHLKQALNFIAHVAMQDGIVLFIARSPENGYFIEKAARECGEYAHVRHWKPGTLLNKPGLQQGDVRIPDIAVFLSTMSEMREQHLAVRECAKLNIPTIAVVDSNCCPKQICYPVPGNDDTYTSVQLFTSLFKEAVLRGKRERQRRIEAASVIDENTPTKQSESSGGS